MSFEIIAIIPARGGSKGIPRKNLVPLAGRLLLTYTIDSALASKYVTRVIVSTDDDEIAGFAASNGAEVIHRPKEIAGDEASSESALQHVVEQLEAEGSVPDLIVFLQATSPLRAPGEIDAAVQHLIDEQADSLFSACRIHGFVWRRTGDELRSMTYDFGNRQRRQEIGSDWLENGSIYVFKPRVLRDFDNRLGGKIAIYEMDPLHSFQVDEPGDIERIEKIRQVAGIDAKTMPDLSKTRLVVLDFDGVMTDDKVIVRQDGTESVVCHRGDGFGIEKLRRSGIEVVVLSKETNPVVAARCQKLGIECFQGFDDKLPHLRDLAKKRGLGSDHIVYVGNDLNDLQCVEWAGVGVAVADSNPGLLTVSNWITQSNGGNGAVREVCDAVLRVRENDDDA